MQRIVPLALALCLAAVSATHAQPATAPQAKPKGDEPWLKFTITSQEREVLKQHYGSSDHPAKQKPLPPGLQKKVARGGQLPPGWQKKVARGEVMPADVYKHTEPLSKVILVKLPPQPRGTILVKVEGKIVRLVEATKTIIDVLDL
jgi:hypothetical protein